MKPSDFNNSGYLVVVLVVVIVLVVLAAAYYIFCLRGTRPKEDSDPMSAFNLPAMCRPHMGARDRWLLIQLCQDGMQGAYYFEDDLRYKEIVSSGHWTTGSSGHWTQLQHRDSPQALMLYRPSTLEYLGGHDLQHRQWSFSPGHLASTAVVLEETRGPCMVGYKGRLGDSYCAAHLLMRPVGTDEEAWFLFHNWGSWGASHTVNFHLFALGRGCLVVYFVDGQTPGYVVYQAQDGLRRESQDVEMSVSSSGKVRLTSAHIGGQLSFRRPQVALGARVSFGTASLRYQQPKIKLQAHRVSFNFQI